MITSCSENQQPKTEHKKLNIEHLFPDAIEFFYILCKCTMQNNCNLKVKARLDFIANLY